MKLPYSWLQELVPQLPPVHDLEPILANMGLPLEGIEEVPAPPEGVLLAAVTAAEPIEGTQLTKLTLDVGPHGTKTIASGAPNAAHLPAGTMVALVTPGTRLGDVEYGIRSMQGVESWGMAASAKELGIGETSAGLMLFAAGTAKPGTPMRDLWAADHVLDVEVTPNRGDVLSALGLARDLAAFLKLQLVEPEAGPQPSGEGEIRVSLPPRGVTLERDPSQKIRFGCDYFAARTVNGVQNGPSPLWMQRRLTLSGMRPIDLIVDTSNYVMLELGQPTALYDRRDVTDDQILVAFGLRQGEIVRDLLGNEHTVGPEDLLILDGREVRIPTVAEAFATAGQPKPGQGVLGIAGIVGGEHGHVRADTSDVVIESAHFDPVLLRRTSTRLGLKTDAVYRYERGVDPLLAPRGANRVAGLLAQSGGGQPDPGATLVGQPEVPGPIEVTGDQIRALLGMEISTDEMVDILHRLGCRVEREGDRLTVTPPSWRVDMSIWQDVAEEVARLHGYAHLPETLPTLRVHTSNLGAEQASQERATLRRTLSGLGFQEVVTYTFTSDEEAGKARSERPGVRLRNPLTADRTGMRTALYPSLLKAAQVHPKGERVLLFEIGRIFPASGEEERLGLLMRGPLAPQTHAPGVAGSFGVFKGLVGALAASLGAELDIRQVRGDAVPPALHPGIAGEVVWNGQGIGWLGALHPEIAQEFGLKGDTFLLEVALPLPGRPWAFRDPSRAPAAWRDLAVIAPDAVSYGDIAALLRREAGDLLESVEPFDVYVGAPIPEGQRSVAVRLVFRGQKTLTDAEVDPVMDRLIQAVRAQGWSIREK
ncbi:phenylalanine--tRNA ligase subunit beta [Deinococcus metallilatus]|uniref:Phenylalanine--tRNA ligase beta subunit n=1 Tax=Deinococcus metallilatus TaxID=1211322 RepID=A0AAJ5F229_9DEIO|nr:phenylalanine--tRNA ligase subunit beta [Deinococcus metallilatus]MBB5296378.1 phenylalanyl-tRNA synthetase beta chain [Deinococcus metallilatus]QBY09946.1 phenylalanine--tRNA ligase subunit beta [Deinococcus metallilatus]RXJ08670.1 phenylalanine--tRNA ligase subunit beta [Deinococcus metallilatus]TLK25144.1 phenylalanine--tRNA ligase subunit beta [Deinococcus metallilatus]GMA14709.1 phenylalanine--tRNA ligase beta subunit [Deinococcus metallilatus]